MGMEERNKDARTIIRGACNPVAVAAEIYRHSLEMLHEGTGMNTIREEPSLRLMVYQLAHLYGVLNLTTTEFCQLTGQILEGCDDER